MNHQGWGPGHGMGMGPGMMGCQMMGSGMMGPGGMMGSGTGCCGMGGMGQSSWSQGPWKDLRYNSLGTLIDPLNKKQAKEIADYYVAWMGNPRLKVGDIDEKESVFEVSIVTNDNSLVNKLIIDKQTGSAQPQMQ